MFFAYVTLIVFVAMSTIITPKIENVTFKNSNIFGSTYLRSRDFSKWSTISNSKKKGIILGSSTAYRNINPYILRDVTHVDWFNLGSSAQSPTISLFLLRNAIRKTKIDYVLLDVFSEYIDDKGYESTIDWLKNSDLSNSSKLELVVQSPIDLKKINVFFYWMFKSWVPSKTYFSNPMNNGDYIGNGHVCYTPDSTINLKMTRKYKTMRIDANRTIQEIIFICKKEDIKLIINICPVIGVKNISTLTHPFVFNNDDFASDINNYHLYYDTCHMTCEGATIYSYSIANKLNKILQQ